MDEILKRHGTQKHLAIVMALLMILSLLPDSIMQVRAEKEETVITVMDADGAFVEGAYVSYKISLGSAGTVSGDNAGTVSGGNAGEVSGDNAGAVSGDGTGTASGDRTESVSGDSVSDGDENASPSEITGSGITDAQGKIAITIPALTKGMTISLEISKEGFGKRIVQEQPLEANMEVFLRKIPEIQTRDSVYNKEDQELVSVSCSDNPGDVIIYSTDGVNWQEDVPKGKAAGEYSVYVRVLREGYEPFESKTDGRHPKGNSRQCGGDSL